MAERHISKAAGGFGEVPPNLVEGGGSIFWQRN